jgi:hypothetical protein
MGFTAAKADKLRAAWFGPLTAGEIAKAFRVASDQVLRNFWGDEKAAGRLPDAARPHFANRTAKPVPVEADIDPGLDRDAVPINEPNPRFDRECDAVLEAMRKHHADLDNDAAHTAPANWLWFDLKTASTPSHQVLMAMARTHDRGRA